MGFSKDLGSSPAHPQTDSVVVYTTSGCTRCDMLKKWLKNKNANFEEKNLEDSNVMTDLVMRNFVVMSAPALEIDGVVYTDNQIFENNGLIKQTFSKVFEVM
jgi:glutaredoxin